MHLVHVRNGLSRGALPVQHPKTTVDDIWRQKSPSAHTSVHKHQPVRYRSVWELQHHFKSSYFDAFFKASARVALNTDASSVPIFDAFLVRAKSFEQF